jgi:hypothetical protein
MRTEADTLDKWQKSLLASVIERTGKDEATLLKDIFDYEDHFYTPEEAKEYGLIDVIEDAAAVFPNGVNAQNAKTMDYAKLQDAYSQYMQHSDTANNSMLNKIAALFGIKQATNKVTNNNLTDMDTKKLAASLGMPADANEEQITAKIAEVKAIADGKTATDTPKDENPSKIVAGLKPATTQDANEDGNKPSTVVTVDKAEWDTVKAKADKVDAALARLKDVEDAVAKVSGGAPAGGDFKPEGDDKIKASFLGAKKSIFE